jgi:rubrerythrin
MRVQQRLTEKFVTQLVKSPEGRAHLLNQIAEAEDNGEARVFDDAIALVDDPALKKMIARHRDDEIRHGQLFRACMRRTNVDPGPVPNGLKVIDNLSAKMGGFFDAPITDAKGVMEAYLVLQVLEERACEQFPMYERVFSKIDPETAAVFAEVGRDEARHLKYCHAISKRYAPDEETRIAELQRLRRLEAESFRETQRANMSHVEAKGLMENKLARVVFGVLGRLSQRVPILPFTSFARLSPAAA